MELIEERRKILLNAPHLQITPSSNFSTDVSAPLKELKIDFSPIQSGSGIPAPDNIRPIDGRQQVSVRHFGKNLFDFSEAFRTSGLYYGKAVGTAIEPGSSTNVTTEVNNNIITVTTKTGWQGVCYRSIDVPNGTYTLSFNINLTNWTGNQNGRDIYVVDKNNIITRVITHTTGLVNTTSTITLTGDESAIAISLGGRSSTYGTFEIVNLQLEAGRNKTPYEPFIQKGNMIGGNWINIDDLITAPGGQYNGYTFEHILELQLKPNTTYTMSSTYTGSRNVLYFNGSSTNEVVRASTPRTKTTDATGIVKVLLYNREGIEQFLEKTVTIMLNEGAEAFAYQPYQGIGYYLNWGRNLIGGLAFANQVKTVMPAATLDTTEETISFSGITTSTQSIEIVSGIFKPNTQYTFIHTGTTGNTKNIRWLYDDDSLDAATRPAASAYVSTIGKTVKALIKINNNSAPVVFQYMNCGIFEGAANVNEFIPYTAKTVYGGTADLAEGTLTIDRELVTVDSISTVSGTYIKSDAIDGYTTNNDIYPRIGYANQPTNLVADKLKLQNNAIWSVEGYPNCWILNNNQIHINVANDLLGITDYTQETAATAKEKLNAWLAENPVTVTIPIEPIVYQLNPVQIKALYGGNNFLTDEGDVVQINHWQHIDKLPIEYQRVEYLQSTGTQYINTGKIPTDNTKMELKTYTTCTASYYCAGARSGSSTIFFAQSGATSGSKISCTVNGTSRTAEDSDGVDFKRLSSGQIYDIMLRTNGDSTYDYSIIDETNNKSYSASKVEYTPMGTVTYGICLFALNKNYIVSGTNRCYKFKLYRDGKLILSFIPCYRKKDNVAGMYDIVTGKFFTNDGTGSFAVGNNI